MNEMNKELAKSIGSVAREARRALHLTQEDAADRIQVSVEFYARIERGTSLPSINTFARIVSALGVSADAMLGNRALHPAAGSPGSLAWAPAQPSDSPELRRALRRLRKARPSTLRLVNLLVKEFEDAATLSGTGKNSGGSEGETAESTTESEIASNTSQQDEPTVESAPETQVSPLVSGALEGRNGSGGTLPAVRPHSYDDQGHAVAV